MIRLKEVTRASVGSNGDARVVKKKPVLVAIDLEDGSTLKVHLFVQQLSRLTDLLNDERKFLPVQTADGKYLAIAKSFIRQVVLNELAVPEYQGSDPYRILGLERGVSLEELKRAYHELLLAHHPDRIRGFGLGAEYQELGTRSTARINQAYAELLKSFELSRGEAGVES